MIYGIKDTRSATPRVVCASLTEHVYTFTYSKHERIRHAHSKTCSRFSTFSATVHRERITDMPRANEHPTENHAAHCAGAWPQAHQTTPLPPTQPDRSAIRSGLAYCTYQAAAPTTAHRPSHRTLGPHPTLTTRHRLAAGFCDASSAYQPDHPQHARHGQAPRLAFYVTI